MFTDLRELLGFLCDTHFELLVYMREAVQLKIYSTDADKRKIFRADFTDHMMTA